MTTTSDVTRTCQPADVTSAGLVAALEQAWAAIRARHSEVPTAVLVVGSGSPAKPNQHLKYGHFAGSRWQAGTDRVPEVLISGEGLNRPAAEVFTTLLHEAVHGLANTRDVKDTSRQGRWHNKKFATLAAELGLTARKDDKLGYSPCTLTDPTTTHYQTTIDALHAALNLWRHPEPSGAAKGRTNNNNGVTCQCECPRKLRVAGSVLDDGPIVCAVCAAAFLPDSIDRDDYNTAHPVTIHVGQSTVATPDDAEGDDMVYYDPTGARYGRPTYPYRFAPTGLATLRQLRAQGLRPGGQDIAAQIMWRKGKRVAYLYRIDHAVPKRTATPAQHAALARALLARRTCPTCHTLKDYYIPRRYGECLDCASGGTP